jgi:hypothetical protein
VLLDDLRRREPREGRAAGDHVIERRAQRVDVRPTVEVGFAAALLGRGVAGAPDEEAVLREARGVVARGTREPQVEELGGAVGRDHDVRGFHVAVDEAAGVRVLEGLGDRARDGDDLLLRERAALLQALAEVLALYVFERAEVAFAFLVIAELDAADDVRMVEA